MLKSTLKTVKPSVIVKGNAKAMPVLVKRKLTGTTRNNKRHEIWLRAKGKCESCGEVIHGKGEVHLDHIVPVHMGGLDDDDNLQVLCVPCHTDKSKKELEAQGDSWNGRLY